MLQILLQLQLLLSDYSIYSIEGKYEINQKMLCVCKLSKQHISKLIWVLSWNFQTMLKGEDFLTKRQYADINANATVLLDVLESYLCGTVSSILERGKFPLNCSSHRSTTISCTYNKVLLHMLVPFVITSLDFGPSPSP